MELANLHSQATKVGIINEQVKQKKYCVCCGISCDKTQYKMLCCLDDFLQYGPTITIAFKFVKYCAITIFIIFIITNIFTYYFSNEVWSC